MSFFNSFPFTDALIISRPSEFNTILFVSSLILMCMLSSPANVKSLKSGVISISYLTGTTPFGRTYLFCIALKNTCFIKRFLQRWLSRKLDEINYELINKLKFSEEINLELNPILNQNKELSTEPAWWVYFLIMI